MVLKASAGFTLLLPAQDDGTDLVAGPSSWTFMPADRCKSYNPAMRNALSSDAHGFTVHPSILPGFGLHQCNPTHTIWNTLDLGPQQVSDLTTDPILLICAAELGSTTGPRPCDSTIHQWAKEPYQAPHHLGENTWSDRPLSVHRRIGTRLHINPPPTHSA